MKRILFCMLAMLIVFVLVTPAQATLITRGTGTSTHGTWNLIYDTGLDITWYDYSHTGNTWDNQVAWAGSLSVDFGGDTYDDWRLPTTVDNSSSFGDNKTTSEMGHLFYTELGGSAGSLLSDTGDFQKLISSVYWSGTGYSVNTLGAWLFVFYDGYQGTGYKGVSLYGLAVRSGDVAAVPEPTTIALLGIGLAGMGVYGVRRRRQLRSFPA